MRDPDWERWPVSEALRREMVAVAQSFQKEPTQGEAALWAALRGRRLDGTKFRRQQRIGPYVVDFYAPEYRLIVEVDGPVHETQRDDDEYRQVLHESLGLSVLRLRTELVEKDLSGALEKIRAAPRERARSR